MKFLSYDYSWKSDTVEQLWLLFHHDQLLIKIQNESVSLPNSSDLTLLNIAPLREQYFRVIENLPCYCGEIDIFPSILSDTFKLVGVRQLLNYTDETLFWTAGHAYHLVHWNRTHQYCGQCGKPFEFSKNERSKICPTCGLTNYPRISPAIIVAIVKENQILLAQGSRFPGKFFSVLAGFVEPGENLEDCVKREVMEEVGIEVQNISYFGSQPWPFPNSLMIGFTAEYKSGEIHIDENEIREAGWYTVDNLPPIPTSISISRKLIDWFISTHK